MEFMELARLFALMTEHMKLNLGENRSKDAADNKADHKQCVNVWVRALDENLRADSAVQRFFKSWSLQNVWAKCIVSRYIQTMTYLRGE